MGKKKQLICSKYSCYEYPYLGGLCEKHYEEQKNERWRRNAAIDVLSCGTASGFVLTNNELKKELEKIRIWWHRACSSVRCRQEDEVLQNETEYALDWCIALAEEIIDAEIAFRNGKEFPDSLKCAQEWVWERFKNLESGLMSNGVKRIE